MTIGARLVACALLLTATAGCRSGANRAQSEVTAVYRGGTQFATLEGTDSLAFVPTTVKAKPGKLTLTLDVTGVIPHNLELDGVPGASIPNVPGHEHASVSFVVTAGSYTLICTYHPEMRGRLIVAP